MNMRTPQAHRNALIALSAAIALTLPALPAFAGQTVERTIPASPNVEIDIEILSGEITIEGWDRPEVHIQGTLGEHVRELEIDVDGKHEISIEIDLPEGRYRGRHDLSADLKLSVPYGAEIDIETMSADVTARDLRGLIELASMSGKVDFFGNPRSLEAETISGNVLFEGETPDLDIESVSGDIGILGAGEWIKVTTVNGNIKLKTKKVKKCNLESVSGGIDFSGGLDLDADLDFAVHSSNVRLDLPAATSANFEIDTFSGEIENAFGPAAKRESKWMTAKTLEFSIGEGSGSVKIESFSGNVTLAKE